MLTFPSPSVFTPKRSAIGITGGGLTNPLTHNGVSEGLSASNA
jgi:hypothetical protein